jgi:GTPase
MVKNAISALEDDVDLVLFMVDATEITDEDVYIDKYILPKYDTKKILVINKCDLVHGDPVENIKDKIDINNYNEVVPVSALYRTKYRARIRNHGHSCFLCEIVIRSQFHTTYEPEA